MKKQTHIEPVVNAIPPNHDKDYAAFLNSVKVRFAAATQADLPIFTVNVVDLFELFLEKMPAQYRQLHNCRTCRKFFDKYGPLVTIGEDGKTSSIMWHESLVPEYYKASVKAVKQAVESAAIISVFYDQEREWGASVTNINWQTWNHVSVLPSKFYVHKKPLKTPHQDMAEKVQDYNTMQRALQEFSVETLQQAVTLLKTDSLYRSEKCLGVAEWLLDLQNKIKAVPQKTRKNNILWKAVASAPAGFCHPRSSMIGTLLEDIESGMTYDQVAKRFADKMNPTQYMRPQAAPSAGNIKQAEAAFQKLEAVGSLRRRYARLDEINCFWKPSTIATKKSKSKKSNEVFGHLTPKVVQNPIKIPPITMTLDKFFRTVLPQASKIEMLVPDKGTFSALVTAADENAPPIIQWDFDNARNPVSWYVYTNGSFASTWSLKPNTYVDVTGICVTPAHWGHPIPNQQEAIHILLKDCRNTQNMGLCIFPEILKSDFHSIRSTIEAHSNSKLMEGRVNASACGIRMSSRSCSGTFRVTDKQGNMIEYNIDRWD